MSVTVIEAENREWKVYLAVLGMTEWSMTTYFVPLYYMFVLLVCFMLHNNANVMNQ